MAYLTPDDMLVKCTQCGAWPVSLVENENLGRRNKLTFRCAKCRTQEIYEVGVAGQLFPAPPQKG
jgi:hypothetical protein